MRSRSGKQVIVFYAQFNFHLYKKQLLDHFIHLILVYIVRRKFLNIVITI